MSSLIKRKRGDDYSIFLWVSDGGEESLDVVNTSAVLSVSSEKEPVAPVTYVFQITGEIYGETSDGIYEFPFTSSEADNLGKFYYDVSYTDAGGKTRTTNEGTIIFSQDIGK